MGSAGFEPTEPSPVLRFSKPLHSTTLPTSHASRSVPGVKRCSLPLCHCVPLPGPQLRAVFPCCHSDVCFRDSVSPNPTKEGTHSAAFQYRLRCPCPFTLFSMQKSKPRTPSSTVYAKGPPVRKAIKTRFFVTEIVPGTASTPSGCMLNRKSRGGPPGI